MTFLMNIAQFNYPIIVNGGIGFIILAEVKVKDHTKDNIKSFQLI